MSTTKPPSSEHTIENLCKEERSRVLEMLKQVNELNKRCSTLEAEIDAQSLENQRLVGSNDVMTQQLDAAEQKLFEAIQLSKDSETQIDRLSRQLKKTQAERNSAQAKNIESTAEVEALREEYRQLKTKHDHVLVDTTSQYSMKRDSVSTNTDDWSEFYRSSEGQTEMEMFSQSGNEENPSTIGTFSGEVGETELDEDTISIIKLLNHL